MFIALCLVHVPRMHCRYSEVLEPGYSFTNTSLAGQQDLCNGLPWAVKSEDKNRHGAILYRFKPHTWISVCAKGKPVSLTLKLPVTALGSICGLSGVGHGAKLIEMSL